MNPVAGDPPSGEALHELIRELYPICRSITGDGVRETLSIIGRSLPLEVREVPSGTEVLDWVVPPEWNVRDAYVADATGARVVDFRTSNLHLVNYSVPVRATMTLDELRPHLHTLPDQPDLVPYRTTYYDRTWGFCLSQHQLDALGPGDYEVVVDTTLEDGSLTYGEVVVPGRSDAEVLVSTHVCHPSLCDDNLSGIVVSAALARALLDGDPPARTHRFVYAPGTIGAITWLATHRDVVPRIVAGLTLTCLGDLHPFTYKRTLAGDSLVDRAAEHVLRTRGTEHDVIDYFPYGYDERQYNSPGFRAPVGSLMRGRHGRFAEYHTSADDPGFVHPGQLVESYTTLRAILAVVDGDRTVRNTQPFGEPQLGRRGLYHALGGTDLPGAQLAMLWVLALADGAHSLLDIADRSGIDFATVAATADVLEQHELLA